MNKAVERGTKLRINQTQIMISLIVRQTTTQPIQKTAKIKKEAEWPINN